MTEQYYQRLAEVESSNRPRKVNELGFLGLYQMGERALIDVGYYKWGKSDTTHDTNDWTGEWTGKNGINSKEDFLSHPEVQSKAVKEYHLLVWHRYLKDYKKYEGLIIKGMVLTKATMISCAHLVGFPRLKKFIDSNGELDHRDKNLVPCSKYMEEFGDYDLDLSVDTKDSQQNKKEKEKSNKKEEAKAKGKGKSEGAGKEDVDLVKNLFEYFDTPEIREEGINNLQRFEILENKAKAEGDEAFVDIFSNVAESHKQVFDFLDKLNPQEAQEDL